MFNTILIFIHYLTCLAVIWGILKIKLYTCLMFKNVIRQA